MAKRKLEIKATDEQLDRMYESIKAGAPLQIALKRAAISVATYYYWVAIASIVITVKSQEEIEELDALAKSGVSIQNIRELAANESRARKDGIGTFIEPSAESILQYKNNRKFKKFADQCYEIVSKVDSLRSDFATSQLVKIALSTNKKNQVNPSGAMWWLERNLPDLFAKPSDKAKESEEAPVGVPPIQVEFIDPDTRDTQQRLLDMEQKILDEMKGNGEA